MAEENKTVMNELADSKLRKIRPKTAESLKALFKSMMSTPCMTAVRQNQETHLPVAASYLPLSRKAAAPM